MFLMGTNSLKDQIQQFQEANAGQMPQEIVALIGRVINELRDSGVAKGLSVGEKAPNFTLRDALGNDVELYKELGKGPVVLTFYRGQWCPYCNLQLKAYQEILPEIHDLGAQLIAVNPQNPDNSLTMKEKAGLSFTVLSDVQGLVAEEYKLRFDIPAYIQEIYQKMGLNLSKHNAGGEWALPVPATMIIDQNAIVRSAFVDTDYTKRMESQDILDALNSIN